MNYLREQKEAEENNKSFFDNEQMLLHFYDISESIKLKSSKESISSENDLIVNFRNQYISIDPDMVNTTLTYEELNNTYRLEAKTLIEEIILRIGDERPDVSEATIINFINEIIKQKKLQDEKEAFKRKIVWLKK